MRFFAGCLFGLLVSALVIVGGVVALNVVNSPADVPLVPVTELGQPDLTITIGEPYLNEQLKQALAARGLGGSDLAVKLTAPNHAEASMTLSVGLLGRSVTVRPRAGFHLNLDRDTVKLVLDGVDLSGVPVPQALISQQIAGLQNLAETEINHELELLLTDTGLRVVGVQVVDGALVVQLKK